MCCLVPGTTTTTTTWNSHAPRNNNTEATDESSHCYVTATIPQSILVHTSLLESYDVTTARPARAKTLFLKCKTSRFPESLSCLELPRIARHLRVDQ
ncbi:hypothetical protein E2C01_010093 [Portunus trituberculatus]|uniref:Uncharacterized protein n=1 Tax=Portunus trituberculatus TaxID=210409 RepID=A0A5B7D7K8_PORTR|nr:hypothetical protein [Portunus trituberculatus]